MGVSGQRSRMGISFWVLQQQHPEVFHETLECATSKVKFVPTFFHTILK
jgi:hypothetical protein